MTAIETISVKQDKLIRAFKKTGVNLAFLFGSTVYEASSHNPRDIDIGIQFDPLQCSFDTYIDLLERLGRVLDTNIEKIDLVILNRANPGLKLEVLLNGVLIYVSKERILDEFAVDTLFEYEDYRLFNNEHKDLLNRRIEEGLSMAKRKVDRKRMENYLSQMDEAVDQLTALRERFASYEEFKKDTDTRELCVHYLRIALESALDICRHFLAVKGVSLTEIDTTNLIELAGEKGLLDPDFAHRIRGMAGMRNAIVHVYWRLDYQVIYEAVTDRLEDFDQLAREVKNYLEKEAS